MVALHGLEPFITRCITLEVDATDGASLNTKLGPHGRAMRTGQRVGQVAKSNSGVRRASRSCAGSLGSSIGLPPMCWFLDDGTRAGPANGPVWEAAEMKMTTLADAPAYDSEQFVAAPLLDGSQSNVRVIRLSPGQTLPPHTHSTSDLMIYIVEGTGTLTMDGNTVNFDAGSLAYFRGDEELRLSNTGTTGLTALAFLATPFPPKSI